MHHVKRIAIAAIATFFPANLAAATTTTIDFAPLNGLFARFGPTYTEKGFRFSIDVTGPSGNRALLNWGPGYFGDINSDQFSADPTRNTLSTNAGSKTTTVQLVSGGQFDFVSVDLADIYNNFKDSVAFDVLFTFNTPDGSTSQTVTVDGIPGLQTFQFNRPGLTSFSFLPLTTANPFVQTDNFVLGTNAGGVPEPAGWAMMIAGFGLTGTVLRRRRVALVA